MSRLRTNSLAMIGAFLAQAVFVFLQMKILTHWMPRAEFGLFSAVLASGALLSGLAELGFPVVLVRYGSKFEAEGRPDAVLGLVGLALRRGRPAASLERVSQSALQKLRAQQSVAPR